MNLVGKVFTVLIFVLSLVFMSFAVMVYATHKNWREAVENPQATATAARPLGLKYRLEAARTENERLKEQLDKEKRTYDAILASETQTRAKLETARFELATENEALRKQQEVFEKELRLELAEVKTTHQALENLRKEVEVLRQDIRDAQTDRDKHFTEVVRVTDELHQAANELVRLKELNSNLAEQHARALEVLRLFGKQPDPELYREVPPMVEGVITATPAEGIVEVSIGADDGLLPGHQLFVYRTSGAVNTLVGKVEVVRTSPDRAVCKSLREWAKSNIVKGDRVASNIQ
jgi:hypothetical protein